MKAIFPEAKSRNPADARAWSSDVDDAIDRYASIQWPPNKPGSQLASTLQTYRLFLRSGWAVSSSPAMENFSEYRKVVNSIDYGGHFQPESRDLRHFMALALSGKPLPRISSAGALQLVSALISFVDDYTGPFPEKCFQGESIVKMIRWIEKQKYPLSIPELFRSKVLNSVESALDQLLILHASLRLLARGRDFRTTGGFRMTMSERLELSSRIAPFSCDASKGGDPPGDAYHYLANFIVGYAFELRHPSGRWPIPLFKAGPYLMKWIRQSLFGNVLFFGNHASIDHMGLAHGRYASRHLIHAANF